MFKVDQTGGWGGTIGYLDRMSTTDTFDVLTRYAAEGVMALRAATPKDTGETADHWYAVVTKERTRWTLSWGNTLVEGGTVPVAVLIQYGHVTRNGGFVPGSDYINPAIKPILDRIEAEYNTIARQI